jgi:gag-polypeptide of LTR copia-type
MSNSTTTSTPSLSDFANAVDKLESNGSNWVMFQKRFTIAAKQKRVFGQLDGSNPKPVVASDATETEAASQRTQLAAWQEKEDLALYLLSQKLPDSIFSKVMEKDTVANMWSAIVMEFTEKSMMMRSNLHSEFMAMRYERGADLRAEFNRV